MLVAQRLSRTLGRRNFNFLEGQFGLTEDQIALQELALSFNQKYMADHAYEWDKNHYFPIEVLKEAGKAGFGGIYCSSDYGGSDLGKLEASVIFEALGTGCQSTTSYISIHNMCNWLLDVFGTEEQRSTWQPPVSSFDVTTSYCLTEPGSGSDAKAMVTSAKVSGDDYVLNGSKMFISGGDVSGLYIVMAKTAEKEVSCFLLEGGTPGLSFGKNEEKLAWRTQPTQLMTMQDCRVPKRNLIGKPGDGMKIAMKGLEGGRLTISSVALGGAWNAIARASQYMDERVAFKTKLKDFQHLRFKMAEALAELTAARMTVRACAKMMDEAVDDKHVFASIAKLVSTERCFEIAHTCMRMFGGYGLLNEYEVERIFREMKILHVVEGTSEIMLHTIAKALFP